MIEILERKREEVVGNVKKGPVNGSPPLNFLTQSKSNTSIATAQKALFDKLSSVEHITFMVMEHNPVLRLTKYRNILAKIVKDIYGKELSNETVPRACRQIQNTYGLFKVEDNTEWERLYRLYYSK